jgi:hypothetical protein
MCVEYSVCLACVLTITCLHMWTGFNNPVKHMCVEYSVCLVCVLTITCLHKDCNYIKQNNLK